MSMKIVSNENSAADFAMSSDSGSTRDSNDLQSKQLLPRYFSAPLYIMWELTSLCPLRCKHCYNDSTGKATDITPERAMKIAEEIADLKVYSTCLSGGEPSLRSDFFEIARYLKARGASAGTITSGWPIDEKKAELYASNFASVQVSLDGPNATVHDLMRGRAGSFERAVNAISLFKKYGLNDISVAFSITKYNVESFPEVVELCANLGVRTLRTQPIMLAGRAAREDELAVSADRYQVVKDYIAEYNARPIASALQVEWGEPLPHILYGARAKFAVFLRISAEGHYSLSPYLPFVLGNVKDYSIREIWQKGMRRCWEIPEVYESVKNIKSIADVRAVIEKYKFTTHDVLSPGGPE